MDHTTQQDDIGEDNESQGESNSSNDKPNYNDEMSNNENSDTNISKYTPIIKMIEKDSKGLAPPDYDLTQKIMIIYGIAAHMHKIYKEESSKVNISPNYILLNENFEPYINVDKMNTDSKIQNANDFAFFNAKFKKYLPPEILNDNEELMFDDSNSKMKSDVYTFGSICLSIMSKSIFDENTDLFGLLDDSQQNGAISESLHYLIDTCWVDAPKRPTFSAILKSITTQAFINDLERFDAERFKEYQVKVVDKEFIEEITSNFDVTSIPNITLYNKDDFTGRKYLGKGMTGTVFKSTNKNTDEIVALKKINSNLTNEDKMRTFREIKILACTDNYAVQKLYGYIKNYEKNNPAILTIYEKNGSLAKLINKKEKNEIELDFTQKFIIMYGIAAGMYYLHTRNILHRDLKPENILLNDNLEPLIADFGLSKFGDEEEVFQSYTDTGTVFYMAPELISNFSGFFALFDARLSDVYSYSILLYCLFTGEPPWRNEYKARTSVSEGLRPAFPDQFPHIIRLLIEACWAQEPKKRPTFEDILHIIGHPEFTKHVGENLDMKRFEDYKSKVLIDTFVDHDILSSHSNRIAITIKDVKFPRIPEKKLFSDLDFKEVPSSANLENPFFIIKKIENKKGFLFNQIEVKPEYTDDEDIIRHFSTQIQVLLRVEHPTINPLYGVINFVPKIQYKRNAKDLFEIFPIMDNGLPVLATPYMPNGNLLTNQSKLSITQKFIILYGISAGMYYLHKNGMTHLNLKPENILLNEEFEPIINIDITSRLQSVKESMFYVLPAFSFPYVAPELLNFQKSQKCDCNEKKADVYSFSMIVYFLISGIHPWDDSRGLQPILRKVMDNERPMNSGLIPSPFDKLIEDCWSTNPLKRLSFKNILTKIGSSDFIRSIEKLDIERFQAYQKKVVRHEFIYPIQIFSNRKRDDFEMKDLIGNGTFGHIMLAVDKENNNKVVCREIPSIYSDLFEKQKNILSKMNFPSIISLYGFIEPDEEKKESVILTPYAENGDLKSMIEKESKKDAPSNWNYTQKCIVIYGIAMGMYILHSYDITHQDLKPENILLSDELQPWITDFAIASFVDSKQSFDQTVSMGSCYYMAPEAFSSRKNKSEYDEKSADVYSFGMIVFYLMTGMQPFQSKGNIFELMQKINEGQRPIIPSSVSPAMKDLITLCWNPDPSSRPSFQQILETICYENFYKTDTSDFNSQLFYDYQIKLGNPQFIKYDDDSIRIFQISANGSEAKVNNIEINTNTNLITPESLLTEMADRGNAESQYRLGCILRDRGESEEELQKAAYYFKQAADQGYIDAIIGYANCLKRGLGVEPNKKEAFRLIKTAIEKGSIDAMVILAIWYSTGRPRKYHLALELLQQANEKGHPDASAFIGSLIERRKLPIYSSKKKVMEYYNQSCLLGSYEGMYHMATFYHYGVDSVVEKNTSEASRLYNLVVKNQNYNHNKNSAIFSLSVLYEEIGELEKAFKIADYYREKDMFVGYVRCSELYDRGIGVERNEEKSKEYLKIAQEERFKYDQLKIALLYSRAKGVVQSKEKFYEWIKISAKNGSSLAQANLANYYLNSEKDFEKAEKWAIKSAEVNNQHGMWNLTRIYRAMKDEEKEIQYLEKLTKLGYGRAFVNLGIKYKRQNKKDEAIEHFKLAANQKLPLGIFHYGNELFHGVNIEKNQEEGLKMIENAAKNGCRRAIRKLITIYSEGIGGVPRNDEIVTKYQQVLDQIDH